MDLVHPSGYPEKEDREELAYLGLKQQHDKDRNIAKAIWEKFTDEERELFFQEIPKIAQSNGHIDSSEFVQQNCCGSCNNLLRTPDEREFGACYVCRVKVVNRIRGGNIYKSPS
jgi:hypothetical protein